MPLQLLELINICQHRDLTIELSPGLTAIIGKNGSGKSNIVKSIYAALTGDFSRNDGVKADNIYQFASKTDPAFIKIRWERNNTTYDLVRALQNVPNELLITYPDGFIERISKVSDITNAILEYLGISQQILSDYVFVDQWSMFDFLSVTPSERTKAFQKLFKLDKATILWKMLNDYCDKYVLQVPSGIDPNLLSKTIIETRIKLEELKNSIENLKPLADDKQYNTYKKLINDYEEYNKNINSIETLKIKNEKYKLARKEIIDKLEVSITTYEYNRKKLENQISAHQARKQLDELKHYKEDKLYLESVKKTLVNLYEQIQRLTKPEMPPGYIGESTNPEYVDWWNKYTELSNRVYFVKQVINKLNKNIDCPICNTPHTIYKEYIYPKINTYDEDKVKLSAADDILKKSRNYDTSLRDFNDKLSNLITHKNAVIDEINRLETKLKTFSNNLDNIDEEALLRLVKDFDTQTSELYVLQVEIAKLKERKRNYDIIIDNLESDINKIVTQLTPVNIDEITIQIAQNYTKDFFNNKEKLISLKVTHNNLIIKQQQDERLLDDINNIITKLDLDNKWLTYCKEMRDILHRDNLPKLITLNYLENLSEEINNTLNEFDCDFCVKITDDLSFTTIFKDGRKIPAARLSGGEKVLLALAFRVTINKIFASDLGLLCLDEPTAGLDESNLKCLEVAINRLKKISSTSGLQVIIITHEKELAHMFENVITLK